MAFCNRFHSLSAYRWSTKTARCATMASTSTIIFDGACNVTEPLQCNQHDSVCHCQCLHIIIIPIMGFPQKRCAAANRNRDQSNSSSTKTILRAFAAHNIAVFSMRWWRDCNAFRLGEPKHNTRSMWMRKDGSQKRENDFFKSLMKKRRIEIALVLIGSQLNAIIDFGAGQGCTHFPEPLMVDQIHLQCSILYEYVC